MIGNDIVDLPESLRESNWQRKGWLVKLFSRPEQALINDADKPMQMVWLLWSMKEAAYKIWNRSSRKVLYAPARFISNPLEIKETAGTGMVRFNNNCYYTSSIISPDFIHTVAGLQNNLDQAKVYIGKVNETSRYLPEGWLYGKDAMNVPALLEQASGNIRPVSFSHHGRFEAIAFWE